MSVQFEEEIEEKDSVQFQRSEVSETMEEDRDALLPHYGCSPFMDIDVRDRIVLPSDQLIIQRCALVEFTNLPIRSLSGSDENSAPGVSVSGNRAHSIAGVEGSANYTRTTKSARACAAEMLFAYRHNNPWGFQVFDVLTGREDAFEIFRSVLPRRMNAAAMYKHLNSLDVDGVAAIVRNQLITAYEEFSQFGEEIIAGSAQEIGDRKAGGKGKARYDRRDDKIALALGAPLPAINPVPQIQMPAQAPIDLAPLADIFRTQAAEAARRDAESAELRRQVAELTQAVSAKRVGRPASLRE
jgi:hypothetical protein